MRRTRLNAPVNKNTQLEVSVMVLAGEVFCFVHILFFHSFHILFHFFSNTTHLWKQKLYLVDSSHSCVQWGFCASIYMSTRSFALVEQSCMFTFQDSFLLLMITCLRTIANNLDYVVKISVTWWKLLACGSVMWIYTLQNTASPQWLCSTS